MMALATPHPHLIDRLPKPRGRLTADAPLGPQTWFATGGPAEGLFRPADVEDLSSFLAALPADVPVMVLGVGSNLLVRDGGGTAARACAAPGPRVKRGVRMFVRVLMCCVGDGQPEEPAAYA